MLNKVLKACLLSIVLSIVFIFNSTSLVFAGTMFGNQEVNLDLVHLIIQNKDKIWEDDDAYYTVIDALGQIGYNKSYFQELGQGVWMKPIELPSNIKTTDPRIHILYYDGANVIVSFDAVREDGTVAEAKDSYYTADSIFYTYGQGLKWTSLTGWTYVGRYSLSEPAIKSSGNNNFGWTWIGRQEGNQVIQECFYFLNPIMLYANTTTPDGYEVDNEGRWTINGEVQRRVYDIQ